MKASTFVVLALALTCVSAISTVEELKESLRVDYPRLDDGQLYDLAKIYITHQVWIFIFFVLLLVSDLCHIGGDCG